MNYNKDTDKIIQIKLNKEEYEELKQESKRAGMPVSKYSKLCITAARQNEMIQVEKVVKNTRKSDRLDVYTEDINALADRILGPADESRGTKLDRLLYSQSKHPDKFSDVDLTALQKEVEKLNENEAEIILCLKTILNRRKNQGKKWLKDNEIAE